MSAGKIMGYSILAVMLLVGTYIYFWALDYVNVALGISLSQSINQDLAAWQYTVWIMAFVLALIIVFNGMASGHHDLEPISSGCYLGFTIFSMFIGCSAVTLNFPFNAFGSLKVSVTVDLAKLMVLLGGGDPMMPPITISFTLIQLLMVSLSLALAVLRFSRAVLKSRHEEDASTTPTETRGYARKPSKSSSEQTMESTPKKETDSMNFMKNVRM